jgi:ABC-2 type transport system permease protein
MAHVLRSEWIKLRTIRMNWVLVIIAVGFPLVVTTLTAALIDVDDIDTEDIVGLITGTSVITAMLLGVVGAATITGEFGFGTIRVTFAATPKRTRVLLAKAIVTVAVAVVVEAVVVLTCYGVASAIASSRDAPLDLGASDGATPAIIGIVAFAAIVALLGYGLGLLIRNTPAAVAVLILWPLVAENIVAGIMAAAGVDEPLKWMPYQSGIAMGFPDLGDETFGRVQGGLYFFAVALVVTALGAIATNRRDA